MTILIVGKNMLRQQQQQQPPNHLRLNHLCNEKIFKSTGSQKIIQYDGGWHGGGGGELLLQLSDELVANGIKIESGMLFIAVSFNLCIFSLSMQNLFITILVYLIFHKAREFFMY